MDCIQWDLLDLISERHMQIRYELEQKWNEAADVKISNAEWHVMAKVKDKTIRISQLSRELNQSRQATHKMLKNMEQKSLVRLLPTQHNKKEKQMELTIEALHYYAQYEELKRALEKKVAQAIGDEHYQQLLHVLQLNWE